MNKYNYYFDEIESKLAEDYKEYINMASVWKNLKINKKKDGGEFANLSSAISDNRFKYVDDYARPYICFSGTEDNYYFEDYLELYASEQNAEGTRKVCYPYKDKPTYLLTRDEIREAIIDKNQHYAVKILDVKDSLENFSKIKNICVSSIENLVENLSPYISSMGGEERTVERLIREAITNFCKERL